jgi:hypothetical protein
MNDYPIARLLPAAAIAALAGVRIYINDCLEYGPEKHRVRSPPRPVTSPSRPRHIPSRPRLVPRRVRPGEAVP